MIARRPRPSTEMPCPRPSPDATSVTSPVSSATPASKPAASRAAAAIAGRASARRADCAAHSLKRRSRGVDAQFASRQTSLRSRSTCECDAATSPHPTSLSAVSHGDISRDRLCRHMPAIVSRAVDNASLWARALRDMSLLARRCGSRRCLSKCLRPSLLTRVGPSSARFEGRIASARIVTFAHPPPSLARRGAPLGQHRPIFGIGTGGNADIATTGVSCVGACDASVVAWRGGALIADRSMKFLEPPPGTQNYLTREFARSRSQGHAAQTPKIRATARLRS